MRIIERDGRVGSVLVGALSVVVFAIVGCRAPPRSTDEATVAMRLAAHEEQVLEQRDRIASRFLRRLELLHSRKAGRGEPGPIEVNVLLLSSGGQNGAFGVGVLNGWSENGRGEFAFPTFDIVTGVSTGAMIAPFTLSDGNYSIQRIAELFKQADDSFAILRGMFFFMPWRSSIFDTRVLRERIASEVDEETVRDVAAAYEEHRILLIGAVDLDLGRFHIWDMGPIAERALRDGDLTLFHNAMISSASIPAAFPPIEIEGVLYTDGAVALGTFLGLDRDVVRQSVAEFLRRHPSADIPRLRMWMIVNGHTDTDVQLARQGWTSVALRSASVIATYSLRSTLRQMQLGSELMGHDIGVPVEFRYIAIPQGVDLPEPTSRLFDQAFMRELHALGYQMGSDPSSWRTDAISPDIPGGSIRLRDVRFDTPDPAP